MQRVPSPRFLEPMAAKLTQQLPVGPEWLYEVKWDGYRALLKKDADRAHLTSRNNKDLGADFPAIVEAGERLKIRSALIDGELVALDGKGRPAFSLLQRSAPKGSLAYYAFDLLELNGKPLTELPLDVRKEKLSKIIPGGVIRLSSPLEGAAEDVIKSITAFGLEGIVAKRRTSKYRAGSNLDWLKFKIGSAQEFVVGGFKSGVRGPESLVVGFYEAGALMYAAVVKQGFTPRNRAHLSELLKSMASTSCPFADLPTPKKGQFGEGITADKMANYKWVTPSLVVQVSFASWTHHHHLRHAIYLGIRSDKYTENVVREE